MSASDHIFKVKVGDNVYIVAYPNADYSAPAALSSVRGTVKLQAENRMGFYWPLIRKFPAGSSLWKFRELLELAWYDNADQAKTFLQPVLRSAAKNGKWPRLLPDGQHKSFGSGVRDSSSLARIREHITHNRNPWDRSMGLSTRRPRR